MWVRPIGELIDGQIRDIPRLTPEGLPAADNIVIAR